MNLSKRHTIEKRITDTFRLIHEDHNSECYPDTPVFEFLTAWYELSKYYAREEDNDIGVEVVGTFLHMTFKLSSLSVSTRVDEKCREDAHEAAGELRMYMEDILNIVHRRLHPDD